MRFRKLLTALAIGSLMWGQTAQFPGAIATDSQLKVAVNSIQTALVANMTSTATTMTLLSSTGIVPNMLLSIGQPGGIQEIVSVTSVSPLVIVRGFDGSSASSHASGSLVSGYLDAWHHNSLKEEVKAIESTLISTGTVLYGTFVSGITLPPSIISGTSPVTVFSAPSVGNMASFSTCRVYNTTGNSTVFTYTANLGGTSVPIGATASLTNNTIGANTLTKTLWVSGQSLIASWTGGGTAIFDCHPVIFAAMPQLSVAEAINPVSPSTILTLFTCCTSGYSKALTVASTGVLVNINVSCSNSSDGSHTYTAYFKPSGGAQIPLGPSVSITANQVGTIVTAALNFSVGDSEYVVVDSGVAGQYCTQMTVIQYP